MAGKKKTFSVIDVYKRLGILKGEFDEEKECFQKRPVLYARSFLCLFSIISLPIKLNICLLFDENDPIQFYIGDWFNGQMDSDSRFWIARDSLLVAISLTILYFALSNLNRNESLLLLTMKKLYILRPKDGEQRRYVGLSKEETNKFWQEENEFNFKLDKFLNVCSVGSGLMLASFNFNTKFANIGIVHYLMFATLHSLHCVLYLTVAFNTYANLNVFIISAFKFFRKRYEAVRLRIEKLRGKRVNNRKLQRVLNDFNYITMELCQINKYWSRFVGYYFFVILVSCIVMGYLIFIVNFMSKIVIFYALVSIVSFIILLPYYQSNQILLEVRKISRELQDASFRMETSLKIKKQINYVSYIARDEAICFTCFDLFALNLYNSVLICTNLITYVIMFLKVSSSNREMA